MVRRRSSELQPGKRWYRIGRVRRWRSVFVRERAQSVGWLVGVDRCERIVMRSSSGRAVREMLVVGMMDFMGKLVVGLMV